MRIFLSGVKARVERLTAQCQAEAVATDWNVLATRLASARTNPRQPGEMTPEEFGAWSQRLRASVLGTSQAKLAERLIAARRRCTDV